LAVALAAAFLVVAAKPSGKATTKDAKSSEPEKAATTAEQEICFFISVKPQ
jgi:hypothetical protein